MVLKRTLNLSAFFVLLGFLACALILFSSVKGLYGNPTSAELIEQRWSEFGPLELSPDRGRYALLYSIVEDKSFTFSIDLARFAAPDLGYKNGKYVSLFAPGVSFVVIPGYILGKLVNAAQYGTFLVIAVFALLNAFLIYKTSAFLGAKKAAGFLGALVFLFATPAFAYAGSLYQHHISTFLVLASIYALVKWRGIFSLLIIWFVWFLGVSVDYPNFIIMLPIALVALTKIVFVSKENTSVKLNIKLPYILSFISIVPAMYFFFWFNQNSYDNPFQLAGTVTQVEEVDQEGNPQNAGELTTQDLEHAITRKEFEEEERSFLRYFRTRRMLNGLYLLFLSSDRGVITFAPIIFLGLIGMVQLYKQKKNEALLLLNVGAITIIFYTLWSDPWGGWAFGSRYMIPFYAIMAIFLANVNLHRVKKVLFLLIFTLLFGYSAYVNTLGALTSNRNPPQVEVLALEALTGRIQRYSFDRNMEMISEGFSKSYFYNTVLRDRVSAKDYFYMTYAGVMVVYVCVLLTNIRLRFGKGVKKNG